MWATMRGCGSTLPAWGVSSTSTLRFGWVAANECTCFGCTLCHCLDMPAEGKQCFARLLTSFRCWFGPTVSSGPLPSLCLPFCSPVQASSKFVLIPGPGDLGPGCSLPRPGLPQAVAAPLLEAVPNAVLGSNPCRWAGLGGWVGR